MAVMRWTLTCHFRPRTPGSPAGWAAARLFQNAHLNRHNQLAMSVETSIRAGSGSALTTASADLPGVLVVPGRLCTVRWRGQQLDLVADIVRAAAGRETVRDPILDILSLELASGSGSNPEWSRPVSIHAVVVTGRDAARTIRRASRWASYAGRVALVPADRVTDQALAEASLRGVWLMTTGERLRVVATGESGPTPGSERGLLHRHLDEVVFDTLRGPERSGQAASA